MSLFAESTSREGVVEVKRLKALVADINGVCVCVCVQVCGGVWACFARCVGNCCCVVVCVFGFYFTRTEVHVSCVQPGLNFEFIICVGFLQNGREKP